MNLVTGTLYLSATLASQVSDSGARTVVGDGAGLAFALETLRERCADAVTAVGDQSPVGLPKGRVQSVPEFLARGDRAETVLFAHSDRSLLNALIAVGQREIVDVTQLMISRAHALLPSRHHMRDIGVIATVPRAGTYRIKYFLYALQEILRHGVVRDPKVLYLYERAHWGDSRSKYYLGDAFDFLQIGGLRVGHELLPGGLWALNANSAVQEELSTWWLRFKRSCTRYPELTELSWPRGGPDIEMRIWPDVECGVKGVLVTRGIVDHVASLLTTMEMCLPRLIASGAGGWSRRTLVRSLAEYFNHSGLFLFRGLAPILFEEAIASGRSLTEVIIDGEILDVLVGDYALLYTDGSAPKSGVRSELRVLQYEDMSVSEESFFCKMVSHIRGSNLSSGEVTIVCQAVNATAAPEMACIEAQLGHSIAYTDRIASIFHVQSHATSSSMAASEARRARNHVERVIGPVVPRLCGELSSRLDKFGK